MRDMEMAHICDIERAHMCDIETAHMCDIAIAQICDKETNSSGMYCITKSSNRCDAWAPPED